MNGYYCFATRAGKLYFYGPSHFDAHSEHVTLETPAEEEYVDLEQTARMERMPS